MHCRGKNSLQRLLRLRQGFKKHLQHTTLQPIFSSILATTGHSWTQLLVVARGPSLLKHDLRKQGNVYSYAPLEGTKHKGITGDVKNSERDRHLIYNVCVQHPCIKPWKGSRSDVYSSPMTLSSKSNVRSQLTERPVCRMQAPAWIKEKHIRISSASRFYIQMISNATRLQVTMFVWYHSLLAEAANTSENNRQKQFAAIFAGAGKNTSATSQTRMFAVDTPIWHKVLNFIFFTLTQKTWTIHQNYSPPFLTNSTGPYLIIMGVVQSQVESPANCMGFNHPNMKCPSSLLKSSTPTHRNHDSFLCPSNSLEYPP